MSLKETLSFNQELKILSKRNARYLAVPKETSH